jgi:adenosylmethionine-8-amino-7-oxononanoate aminotransferase
MFAMMAAQEQILVAAIRDSFRCAVVRDTQTFGIMAQSVKLLRPSVGDETRLKLVESFRHVILNKGLWTTVSGRVYLVYPWLCCWSDASRRITVAHFTSRLTCGADGPVSAARQLIVWTRTPSK